MSCRSLKFVLVSLGFLLVSAGSAGAQCVDVIDVPEEFSIKGDTAIIQSAPAVAAPARTIVQPVVNTQCPPPVAQCAPVCTTKVQKVIHEECAYPRSKRVKHVTYVDCPKTVKVRQVTYSQCPLPQRYKRVKHVSYVDQLKTHKVKQVSYTDCPLPPKIKRTKRVIFENCPPAVLPVQPLR